MKFADIPKFPKAYYHTTVDLAFLEEHLDHWNRPDMGSPLIMNPEWQRGHVWTKEQQIAFMEYKLMGGTTGSHFYFNCSSWSRDYDTPVYCVDGLQRITAALAFVHNEIPVFGHYLKDFEDRLRMADCNFNFNMMNLRSKKQLLRVYIDFNCGGTPHNPAEIERVSRMIVDTDPNETL